MAIQLGMLNYYYQDPMKQTVMFMDSDAFMTAITHQTNQVILYSISFTIFTHFLLQDAFNQAEEAEKKKNDFEKQKNFLLGFSHELRNLINSLIGNVKLASVDNVSEKAKELLLNAEHCAEMLLHLINNILDTGKVELGDLEINTSPIKIYDVMERVWSVCAELIKNKHLRGRMKIQKDIPKVLEIDHYRLMQIFLNLVGNAVKYTDAGEIDITVESNQ
jgi:signal transduction histidine kinase